MEHLQELKEEEADESPGVHNSVISAPSPTRARMNPDNFTHKTNEAALEADCSSYDEENIKQKHQVDNTVEEPDEYYKQQPDKIVEGKPDEYDKTLERPAVKRSPDSLRVFTLDELMSATRNFSEENLLGEGGTIYKGTVDGKHTVAITKFTCAKWPVGCVIDKPALEYLGTMHHPHLVRLLGYCDQGEHNIPIHEYMPRGSLKYHLSLETNLITSVPWLTRLNIAVGAAKGLSFLHKSRKQMMFYTDFKASNILLASDYTAKLWGFGLSTQNDMTVSKRKTREVYNFGEVLLELLAGRPCIDEKRHDHERNLVEWFQLYVFREDDVSRKGIRLRHIMDPDLQWRYSVRASWSTAAIAHQCMDSVPEKRPSMHDVVEALEPLLSDDRNDGPTLANSGGA